MSAHRNGLAIAGFVCSLVGLFLFEIILGPLGIIFSTIALSHARAGAPHRGLAIAGLVIGLLDVVLFIVLLVAVQQHGGHAYWRI